jgi:hypothetical protein
MRKKLQTKRKQKVSIHQVWPRSNAQAAGVDLGAREHWVAVAPDRDPQPVRRFGTCTADLEALADGA